MPELLGSILTRAENAALGLVCISLGHRQECLCYLTRGEGDEGKSELVAQDHAQESTGNRQRAAALVIDKTKLSKLIHEMTDP